MTASTSSDRFLLLLLLAAVLFISSCGTHPPEGTPIDLEAWRTFKPFQLNDSSGNPRRLAEFLDRATLVSFFFPT